MLHCSAITQYCDVEAASGEGRVSSVDMFHTCQEKQFIQGKICLLHVCVQWHHRVNERLVSPLGTWGLFGGAGWLSELRMFLVMV